MKKAGKHGHTGSQTLTVFLPRNHSPHDNWRNFNNSSKKLTEAHSAIFPSCIYRQAKTNNWKEIQTICAALIRGAPTVTTLSTSSPPPFLFACTIGLSRISPLTTHAHTLRCTTSRESASYRWLSPVAPSRFHTRAIGISRTSHHAHTHASLVSCAISLWVTERESALKLIVSLHYKRILGRAPQFVFHLQSRRFTADLALTSVDSVV